jgi:hypothetical protein
MKINTKPNKLKHLAVAVSLVLGLTACSSDSDDPIVIPEPPAPPANNAPVVSSTVVTAAVEGVAYTYTLTATDADAGDTLVLASTVTPAWLNFDVATGVLSGTPATADIGDSAVSLTVTDGTDTVMQDFTITVAAAPVVNTAPIITSTGNTAGTVGSAYSYMFTATDADDDTLTFSEGAPIPAPFLFDASTGVLSGTPDMVGDFVIELTVSDGTDSATQTFTISVAAASTETVVVEVFKDEILAGWSIWTEQGTGAPFTDDNMDYGVTAQFIIDAAGNGVAGFSGRATENMDVAGTPIDISDVVATATISFDLKMLAAPNSGSDVWFLKLEDVGTGSSAEINLDTSNEGHTTPVLDTWLSYSFKVSDIDAGSLDFSAIDLIMIFPQWGTNGSANYLIDNLVVTSVEAPVVPEVVAVEVFKDDIIDGWSIWTEQGTGANFTDADMDYGVTAQFIIDAGGNGVAGFSGRATENMDVAGTPIDISDIVDTATISFDLKMLAAPNSGSDVWFIKIEDTGTGSSAEINLDTSNEGHTTPLLDTWLSYSFKVSDIDAGSLDFSAIDLFMVFPQWGTNGSANYLIDNFVITTGGDTGGGDTGGGDTGGVVEGLGFDFENGNTGVWTVFEDTTSPLEFVVNPDMSGPNTSATVAKFTAPIGAAFYAGTETKSAPTFELDATNSTIRIMVWKTTISNVGIKFAEANGAAQPELLKPNTLVNEWEEMTFDLSGNIGLGGTGAIVDVVVFPDYIEVNSERTVESVVYFDNITFSAN